MGLCDTATVSITVDAVNDPPVATDDTETTVVDVAVVVDVVFNDTDVDGDLDVASTNTACLGCSVPTDGLLTNHGDGTFTYTPDLGFVGVDTFIYEVCDTGGPVCDTATATVAVAAGVPETFEVRVAASSDDAEERLAGNVSLNSSDLELVVDGSKGAQTVGMRFVGMTIPAGSTITSAWVQFQVDETDSGAVDLLIQGQAADNPPGFTNTTGNLTARTKTTAAVPWAPVAWNTIGEAGPDQQTPHLTTVIQEIVDRPGWVSGNALVILVTGTGERTAESYNGNSAAAPLLHVEYTAIPIPNQPPVAADDTTVTPVDTLINVDVAANDTDSDNNLDPTSTNTTCATCATTTDGTLVNLGDGTFDYTPNPGFIGVDTFTYEICDTEPLCDTADVTITITAAAAQTLEIRVAANSDDAEERDNGTVSRASSDLELVVDGSKGAQTVGMRFLGVNLPVGAVITAAWVQFKTDQTDTVTTDLVIQGQAADNPTTFITSNGDISSRPRTVSQSFWSPPSWTLVGEAGPDQQTSDISTIIQEIVDRSGWTSGNAMVIIITGTGERTAESYNGDAPGAPLLHIEYIIP